MFAFVVFEQSVLILVVFEQSVLILGLLKQYWLWSGDLHFTGGKCEFIHVSSLECYISLLSY